MSYGLSGPPKGYSVPRGIAVDQPVAKMCQKCSSKDHWTYECKQAATSSSNGPAKQQVTTGISKLSKTQMLKLGLKKELTVEAPPKTEGEILNDQLKEAARQESRGVRKRDRSDADEVKKETDEALHTLDSL